MAQNSLVRTQVYSGILAAALAVFSPGTVGLKYQAPPSQAEPHTIPAPEDRVDLNSASLNQLMKVPGMTRTWAARIVRYRPYRAKNDLVDKGILPSQVYDRIKDYVIAHRAKP